MRVFCQIPNGLRLTIGNADHETGPIDRSHFECGPGLNDVPDDLWTRWKSENASYGPLVGGMLYEVAPDAPAAPVPSNALDIAHDPETDALVDLSGPTETPLEPNGEPA